MSAPAGFTVKPGPDGSVRLLVCDQENPVVCIVRDLPPQHAFALARALHTAATEVEAPSDPLWSGRAP